MLVLSLAILVVAGVFTHAPGQVYTPDWESLDSRPLPPWYDEAKIGVFLHWGVFSVPSFGSEWFWKYWASGNPKYVHYMNQNFRPDFTYQDFGPELTAEFFKPDEWAELFEDAGARYVVLTSKHHEGFTLWPSKYSFGWNAVDVGPRRNLLGDLAKAIRTKTPDIHFGLYHSLFEWFNPLYLKDKESNFSTDFFVRAKTMPELFELVEDYKPEVIWSDGDGEAYDTYWKSPQFLAWLFNESPVKETVVVNDRWGIGIPCHHGSFYTCNDRYNPGVLQSHKWENCMTLDKSSWGYNRLAKSRNYLTIEELLTTMIETVSCGGNLLVNAGPTPDGRIPPIMEERLRQMGKWLKVNGEAIYGSKPWIYQNDTVTKNIWYTSEGDAVYATALFWPEDEKLLLGAVTPEVVDNNPLVTLVGYPDELKVTMTAQGLELSLPSKARVKSNWAWVFKIQGLKVSRAEKEGLPKGLVLQTRNN